MRRLFITCDYPPIVGGQSNYFKNLWNNLDPLSDRLLLPDCSRDYCRINFITNVRFVRIPSGKTKVQRFFRITALFFAVLRECFCFRPTEVHAGQLLAGGFSCRFLHRLFGFRYFLYIFGSDVMEFTNKSLFKIMISRILEKSSAIIACSKYTAEYLKENYNKIPRVSVVNPGVEERFFINVNENKIQELKYRYSIAGREVLVTVGRLVERKGHDIVIKALPGILKDVPTIHYLIAGEGPNELYLKQLAEKTGVSNRITFCGSIPEADITAYYQVSKVFIMVSRHLKEQGDIEGYGIVYIEANASGLPVIAAMEGGVLDAVTHNVNALLIKDPQSIDEVQKAVVTLFKDKAMYERMSEAAVRSSQVRKWDERRKEWNNAINAGH